MARIIRKPKLVSFMKERNGSTEKVWGIGLCTYSTERNNCVNGDETSLALKSLKEVYWTNKYLEMVQMFSETQDELEDQLFHMFSTEINGVIYYFYTVCVPGADESMMNEALLKFQTKCLIELRYSY